MKQLLGRTAPTLHAYPYPGAWKRWLRAFHDMRQNARTRAVLSQLSDQQLSDVGISHSDRMAELDKPFWR